MLRRRIPLILLMSILVSILGLGTTASAAGALDDDTPPDQEALNPEAAALKFRLGKKKVEGADVEQSLRPAVRVALNEWAGFVTEYDLDVVAGADGDFLVIGGAKEKTLREAAKIMASTWALIDPILPRLTDAEPRATIAFLFNAAGYRSDAWDALLERLVEDEILRPEAAESQSKVPSGVMMRWVPAFLQPTLDLAGIAAQGDDEFRMENEIAHKFTQCMATQRVGPLPPNIQWGLGYLAEQDIFGTTYMFNHTGFVASGDHFDWPQRARQILEKQKRDFSLAEVVMDDSAPGRAERPQLLTWAAMEHLRRFEPEQLAAMITELAAEHARRDTYGLSGEYIGAPRKTREILVTHLDMIETKRLMKTLKSLQ
jgi:hypothetical protein